MAVGSKSRHDDPYYYNLRTPELDCMETNTKRASEVIAESMGVGVSVHVHSSEMEFELDDYNASDSANIEFEYGTPVMANITISGENTEVIIYVDAEDAYALSDVFKDLAKDLEQRND